MPNTVQTLVTGQLTFQRFGSTSGCAQTLLPDEGSCTLPKCQSTLALAFAKRLVRKALTLWDMLYNNNFHDILCTENG